MRIYRFLGKIVQMNKNPFKETVIADLESGKSEQLHRLYRQDCPCDNQILSTFLQSCNLTQPFLRRERKKRIEYRLDLIKRKKMVVDLPVVIIRQFEADCRQRRRCPGSTD